MQLRKIITNFHRSNETDAIFALSMLFMIGVTNFLDRVSISVLQVPMKADLHFSDSQLGLLTGLAFFIPYTLLSIPLARVADRYNRKYLIIIAMLIWSVMTIGISVSHAFMLVLVLRMGVAMGEAACLPTAHSLLSDHFPPEKRGRAFAIFSMSFPLGSMVGIAGMGAMSDTVGWRSTFVAMGFFGLALTPLVMILLQEPKRGGYWVKREIKEIPKAPPFFEAIKILWEIRALRFMALGMTFQTYAVAAVFNWGAPFYTRSYNLELSYVALVFGVITGLFGAIGSFFGGTLADRLGRANQRWYLWTPAIACLLTIPAGLGQFLAPSPFLSFIFSVLVTLMLTAFYPPVYAIGQSLVSPNMRALISSILLMVGSVFGGALGPSITGMLSDLFAEHFGAGADSLAYAICVSFLFSGLAAVMFVFAALRVKAVPADDTLHN